MKVNANKVNFTNFSHQKTAPMFIFQH